MYLPKTNFSSSFDFSVLEINNIRNKNINYLKNDNCIDKTIKNGIYWELWMLKYNKENYIKNTNMIDLGANIGTTSLLMNEVISTNCKIFSFEPLYSDILLKNILDNNLIDKIIIYPYGVGNKKELVKIKNIDLKSEMNFGGVSIIHNLENNNDSLDSIEINIIQLDNFNFENISLIKIDVEHMEIEVLEGSLNLIKHYKPTIIIETYQLEKLEKTDIFKKLVEIGYHIYPIAEGHYDYIMKVLYNESII